MKPIRTFDVEPRLPSSLNRLRDIVYNLRWAWNHDTIELFRRLDSELWETTGHNPALMLGTVDQARLEEVAEDRGFLAHYERVLRDLDEYVDAKTTWFNREHEVSDKRPLVAYFSAEFGVTDCMEIFAGGLGILAGDHTKSSSDLGVPLIGVGLLYQEGYFRQYLNEAGWQQEAYEQNDFYNLPVILEYESEGNPLIIAVPYPGRSVYAQIWRLELGRVSLYLLDTNISANAAPEDRDITDELYGGRRELRIEQEIMLGIGGQRALQALGLRPEVVHLNEGHPAFAALERIRQLMEEHGVSFSEAAEAVSAGLVFTTHTPVSAGHDRFSPDIMKEYFSDYAREVGLSWKQFMALGRTDPDDEEERFCMTTLALRLASGRNAVSELHGKVARRMWHKLWPELPREEVPIAHITNGVHFRSWISLEMNQLYDRYLGPRWREEPAVPAVWHEAEHIADSELWRTHERRRERMVAFARRRLRSQLERRGAPRTEIEAADEVLDPRALTIGFARRIVAYKRPALLLRDIDRLARILNDPERPLQVIYAGKAHPQDEKGKELISEILKASRQDDFRRRLVFLEDYDMAAARYLVQGADVWLNTPRRPHEACGTSGMKAAANGVLNMSTLDGWWAEAYRPDYGWAIGHGEVYEDLDYQDEVESRALYDLLERDVIPTFYDRGPDDLPRRWIARMKASIASLCYFFNTHRMVRQYTERIYLPAGERERRLAADGMARAKSLAAWKDKVRQSWPEVEIEEVSADPIGELQVGDKISAIARVRLGKLTPDDVSVEFYLGQVDADGELTEAQGMPMEPIESKDGRFLYEVKDVACQKSGLHGYTARVLPAHEDLSERFIPGMVEWAGQNGGVQIAR